ncbi:MAG: S9 family peptidase [Candidatus Palauibacterales bacterium]|nr:S9 family peptidase [Candidatus Palauibacterales bacterium]
MRSLALVLSSALFCVLAAPAVATPAAATGAAPDSVLTVEHYLDWEGVSDPRISPDGSRIVYSRSRVDAREDSWTSELWIMRSDGSRKRRLVEGSSPRWSPSGDRIAYVAEGEAGRPQIFVLWLGEEGGPTQVTHLEERPRNVQWSPQGDRLSFVKHVPDVKGWSVDLPAPPEGADWTAPPEVVNRIHYRADGLGWMDEGWTHLFTVPATGGTARQLTSGDWHVGARFDFLPSGGGYDWTPDGSHLVFDGFGWKEGDPDRNYRQSHIYAVEVESKEIRRLTDDPGTWSGPEVGPRGERVAFTGHAETDLTYMAPELWTLPLDGDGERSRLSADLDRGIQDLHWRPDGGGLYFTVPNEGARNVWFAPGNGSGPRQLTEGEHMVSLASLSSDGTAAGALSAPMEPEDVVRYRPGDFDRFHRLTSVNEDVLRDVGLGQVEEMWYRSTDGARVQSWIVKPPSFDPGEEYPMVLFIHGGPHAMYDVGFSWIFQNLAANGFVVLYANPRGSTGYGTDFGAAISQDYPSVDHEDLMTGVDSLVDRGYVDTDRQYVTGCSGGGVLSSWAIGHTDRFEAAAVLCPVIDWISMAGTTDIPYFTHSFFEEPFWENPDPWLEHSSLMYADQVNTPTLLATGVKDLRTPIAQTEEFYQALKRQGVNTVMLRFNEEYHGIWSQPSNFMRAQRYIIEWFENDGQIEGLTTGGGEGTSGAGR